MSSSFPVALTGAKNDYDSEDIMASANMNDFADDINAIASKVGINSSADTDSLDYKINNVATLEVATGAEVDTGTDNLKYATPKAIKDSTVAFVADIPVKATGIETNAGTNDAKFVTPLASKTAKSLVTAHTPAGAGTTTLDLSLGDTFRVTMPAANQTLAISNATVGQIFTVEIVNATSQGTLTWFSTITWARGGSAPALSVTNTHVDTFRFRVTAAGTYLGYDDDTYIKETATQTMTNKTLTSPNINTPNLVMGNNNVEGVTINSIADDAVNSFTPENALGVILIYARNITYFSGNFGIYAYRTQATAYMEPIVAGAGMADSTSVLAGTTGADGVITISATSTDGKIYIENRSGGTVSLGYVLLGS